MDPLTIALSSGVAGGVASKVAEVLLTPAVDALREKMGRTYLEANTAAHERAATCIASIADKLEALEKRQGDIEQRLSEPRIHGIVRDVLTATCEERDPLHAHVSSAVVVSALSEGRPPSALVEKAAVGVLGQLSGRHLRALAAMHFLQPSSKTWDLTKASHIASLDDFVRHELLAYEPVSPEEQDYLVFATRLVELPADGDGQLGRSSWTMRDFGAPARPGVLRLPERPNVPKDLSGLDGRVQKALQKEIANWKAAKREVRAKHGRRHHALQDWLEAVGFADAKEQLGKLGADLLNQGWSDERFDPFVTRSELIRPVGVMIAELTYREIASDDRWSDIRYCL